MWPTLSTAAEVEQASIDLFGEPLAPRPALSHVTALWQSPDEPRLSTIHIDAKAPKDDRDWLALHLSRARADAIVITGKVLRDEPTLSYDLGALDRWGRGLAAWRSERWGLHQPITLVVLTSGRNVVVDHPALRSVRSILFTTDRAARRHLTDAGLSVVADAAPSLRSAIAYLRETHSAQSISIEAGPSTSRTLYEGQCEVDEVLLSTYSGDLPQENRRAALWSLDELGGWFAHESRGTLDGAQWQFRRFTNTEPDR